MTDGYTNMHFSVKKKPPVANGLLHNIDWVKTYTLCTSVNTCTGSHYAQSHTVCHSGKVGSFCQQESDCMLSTAVLKLF